jgi:hypothetical protein
MPANLSPEYLAAEQQFKAAHSAAEKLEALELMLSTIPKHKGTEKLQADIKRRISQLRKESQKKGAAHAVPFYLVPKEGAGQVALLGPANSGKSRLLCALTHARPEVADYPYTTRLPTPGMMDYQNVQIQLVDLPPLGREFMEPWLPQVIRNATASILVVDPGDPEVLDGISFIEETLAERRLPLPKLLVGNKSDLKGAAADFAVLEELYRERYRCLAVSAETGANLEGFARAVFEMLEIVRVYTKVPGKHADLTSPFILRRGQTVLDAARQVHKDFAENLKSARLFRASGGHDGLLVERTRLVEDEDILEFHL